MASEEEKIDTVWKAAAYGDFDALRRFADEQPGALDATDDQGYTCLQWAALNNRVAVLSYLIDEGCDLNAADGTGQTALHWSAVRGAISALETLLRAGANLAATDSRGYTVCHVAAQYGQTAVLYHVAMKWGADTDSLDSDGRSPLHWAAYKGFADTCRLLLVMGSRAGHPDSEGCTPLHWSAIRGNSEACTVLLQGGAIDSLEAKDATGATPSQLAVDKGHRMLGVHLAEYKQRKDFKKVLPGPMGAFFARLHLAPFTWAIILGMLATLAFAIVGNDSFPPASSGVKAGAWATFAFAVSGLYFLFKTTTADPGFLPQNTAAGVAAHSSRRRTGSSGKKSTSLGNLSTTGTTNANAANGALDTADKVIDLEAGDAATVVAANSLDSPALWEGHWGQLCVTCKIVRPLRAKHCSVTDRCVQCFDHYCPWVANDVGRGNRHLFVIFLWLEFAAVLLAAITAVARIHALMTDYKEYGASSPPKGVVLLAPVAFIVFDFVLLISVAALAISQGNQVARNVTTNELANWHRYRYLQASDGNFHNPFDKGWKVNCAEVCKPWEAPHPPYIMAQHVREEMSGGGCCGGRCGVKHQATTQEQERDALLLKQRD